MPDFYCIGGPRDGHPISHPQPPQELKLDDPLSGGGARYTYAYREYEFMGPTGDTERTSFYVLKGLADVEAKERAQQLHEMIQLHGGVR